MRHESLPPFSCRLIDFEPTVKRTVKEVLRLVRIPEARPLAFSSSPRHPPAGIGTAGLSLVPGRLVFFCLSRTPLYSSTIETSLLSGPFSGSPSFRLKAIIPSFETASEPSFFRAFQPLPAPLCGVISQAAAPIFSSRSVLPSPVILSDRSAPREKSTVSLSGSHPA